jgi:hypothetical protein
MGANFLPRVSSMDQRLGLRSADPAVYPKAELPLQLLVELEPAYRVFFRNLADLVLPPTEPPLLPAPVLFPRPFYIRTGVRWTVVLASMASHLAAVLLLLTLWTWSSRWERQRYPLQEARTVLSHARLTYYLPIESFPARGGRQSRGLPPDHTAMRPPIIHLTAGRSQPVMTPPTVRASGAAPSRITSLKQDISAVPPLATARRDMNQFSWRTFASPQASAVAPPPQAGSVRVGLGITLPITVIAPAPALQGSIRARGSGDIDIGPSVVVPPSPRLPMYEQRTGRRMANGTLGGSGTAVVPPPPSINSGVVLGSGIGNSVIGVDIVPPPPSVGHVSILAVGGGDSLTGARVQVVPPPPLIPRSEVLGGSGGGNVLAGMGMQALPVLERVNRGEGTGVGGPNTLSGAGSLGSSGSVQSLGTRTGNGGSISTSAGHETVAGLVSDPAAGNTAPHGQQPTPIIRAAIPLPPPVVDDPGGTTRVLPLRVIQLALALPSTSYFSNYEAFIAERSVNDHTTQLIKLVYIFLPYQRRLTEYELNNSKTFRLRVTRDPSCDESLLSMTWPESEQTHDQPQPVISESSKNKLPCYRTTADDYRKALKRAH